MKLYESGEDYLEAVLMLQKKNGMVKQLNHGQGHGIIMISCPCS